jgi:hypothetical protein
LLGRALHFPLLLNFLIALVSQTLVNVVFQLSAAAVLQHVQVKLKYFVVSLANFRVLYDLNNSFRVGGS